MSANDPFSILNRDPNRGKIEHKQKVTIQRLRPGKLPDWALQQHDPELTEFKRQNQTQGKGQLKFTGMTADSSAIIVDTSQGKVQDILTFEQPSAVDDSMLDSRRALIKQKMLELESQMQGNDDNNEDDEGLFGDEDDVPMVVDDNQDNDALFGDEDDQDDDGQEYEDEDEGQHAQENAVRLKPVFVSRDDRATLGERDQIQVEEEDARDFERKKKEEKKQYTKQMVAESIKREQELKEKEAVNNYDSDDNLPFTDDDDEDRLYLNSQAAYEEWKIRELKRIKRERDERTVRERELAEIERRRKMTDAEREEENTRLGTDHNMKKEKVAYKFMQRFYHKGAFFQDKQGEIDIFNRDYNMPVGEDKMDKSVLPAVLQKRRGQVGKKGNSKWTHLTNEDTTNFDPNNKVSDNIAFKTQLKQGGYKGMNQLDRPSVRKRIH